MRSKIGLLFLRMTTSVILLTLTLITFWGTAVSQAGSAQLNVCTNIYDPDNGWVMELCEGDEFVSQPMEVVLDGVVQIADQRQLNIYHQSEQGEGVPQVMVLYASGFVRLKQNADPTSEPIPFGGSFVLGPAYWEAGVYYHSPQLVRIEIDTTGLPNDGLQITAVGQNGKFDITYQLTLPPPQDRQTRLRVQQSYTATQNIAIDPSHRMLSEGFKLVQFSSMFVTADAVCNDGLSTGCHDSNGVRYIDDTLERRQMILTSAAPSRFLFEDPTPLNDPWLDLLHNDDEGWQGNTPNLRLALEPLPADRTLTPQGWIQATTNPNDDNVGLWLHDDGSASESWAAGESGHLAYWLLAEDNPPDRWAALNLRTGNTFLDFEGGYNCFPVRNNGQPTTTTIAEIGGYQDTAVQLLYDLGHDNGNWAQVRCNFDPPLDLSAFDHLRFEWRGDSLSSNSIEVGLINPTNDSENIFARGYHHASHRDWWGQLVVPFSFLHPRTDDTTFDSSQISALFISVVKAPVDDTGGNGRFALDNFNAFNVANRTVPDAFETVPSHPAASNAAKEWLLAQQTASGLLPSWEQESSCVSHTYDQALALLVFSHAGEWDAADKVVQGLAAVQNENGSWAKSNDCEQLTAVHTDEWLGDVAWAVYALNRYDAFGGSHPAAKIIRNRAADWLLTQINAADGCLELEHTEGTIDVWWALYTSQSTYINEANGIKSCLLTQYWDDEMGRFKGGRSWQQPYLDNQTWGAAFLKAIGEPEKALRALSYARETLVLPSRNGALYGFDGQGGPWAMWNEGTAQFAAVGGADADNFVQELLIQQKADGAIPGSPDAFLGGGVWTTTWLGVAPTA